MVNRAFDILGRMLIEQACGKIAGGSSSVWSSTHPPWSASSWLWVPPEMSCGRPYFWRDTTLNVGQVLL